MGDDDEEELYMREAHASDAPLWTPIIGFLSHAGAHGQCAGYRCVPSFLRCFFSLFTYRFQLAHPQRSEMKCFRAAIAANSISYYACINAHTLRAQHAQAEKQISS